MSKKTIRFALSQESIRQAISEIKAYEKEIEEKLHEVARRLAEIGTDLAQQSFSTAAYDGINDVVVTYEEIPNGYKIVANGNAVCFIEFGAGVFYGGNYPGKRPAGIVGIGEYGKGLGKRRGWWYYSADGSLAFTRGNLPNAALFYTGLDLENQVQQIAREVFGE